MSEYTRLYSRTRLEDICNGEGLADYGERKRIGEGHRRGGTGRWRQRGSWSASDGRTGASGGAIRRAGEARQAGSARRGRRKSGRAVGTGYVRAAGRSG